MGRSSRTYINWNGHIRTEVEAIERPRSEGEVRALIERAVATGRRVKPIGAGHSFTRIGMNDAILVDLSALEEVFEVDVERRQVTVSGGVALARLVVLLEAHGLALANIGAWTEQTIAGVISTATHGTCGRHRKTLIDSVSRVRLVDGTGTLRELARGELDCITLGLFGVITRVTLDCEPFFSVRHDRRRVPLREAIPALPGLLDAHDFVDLRWMGCNEDGLLSTWDKVSARPGRRDRLIAGATAAALSVLLRGVDFVSEGRMPPSIRDRLTLALARVYSAGAYRRPLTKLWYRGLTYESMGFAPRHDEHEYAIPREATEPCLRELHAALLADPTSAGIEVQARFSPAVDLHLAPNFGRDTTWVDINIFNLDRTRGLVERLVAIFMAHDARPHWSKTFFVDRPAADPPWWAQRYPAEHIDAWLRRRRELDPHGVFLNRWYEEVWGAVDAR